MDLAVLSMDEQVIRETKHLEGKTILYIYIKKENNTVLTINGMYKLF